MRAVTSTGGFAAELAERTRPDHERAEQHPFVGELLAGRSDVGAYVRLLGQLHAVYRELEAAIDAHRDHPVVGRFADAALIRLPSIEADMEALAGPGWQADTIPVLPSAGRYRDRIRALAAEWPDGLVAHHYTRYLGDLSGGQVIQRMLQRHYGVDPASGGRFYEFDAIPSAKRFKDTYRQTLDSVAWSFEERDRIVGEASLAFRLNAGIFSDVHGFPAG